MAFGTGVGGGDDGRDGDDGAIDMTPADPARLAWLEQNDIGNAKRLQALAGDRLLFVPQWGWVAYDSRCWSTEQGEHLANLAAHDVAEHLREEVRALAEIPDDKLPEWCSPDMRDDRLMMLRKFAVKSGDASRTAAMLVQAQHLLAADVETFDREELTLNAANGTIRVVRDSDSGKVRFRLDPHDPRDRITKATKAAFLPAPKWKHGALWDPATLDEKAACPVFSDHLDKAMPRAAVRAFLQEVLGYSFTGSTQEQMAFFHQGRGGDGKSTALQHGILNMAGGYGMKVDVKSFLDGPDKSAADASPDMFRLMGDVRFICMEEPKRGKALDEGKMKAFTGGGRMTAREPYGRKIVEFEPRGKLGMECNAKPRIPGADDGIWRRIVVIPWPHQFKGSAIDKTMKYKLREEADGILLWVLAGMARWLERGRLEPPAEVLEAVEDYRKSANPFSEWFAERVDTSDPLAVELSTRLYDDYKRWCEENSVSDREILSSTKFGIVLGDMQLIKWKGGDGKVRRRGCQLRADMPLAPGDGDRGLPPGQAKSIWGEED